MRILHRVRANEELRRSANRFDAVSSQSLATLRMLDRSAMRWAHIRFILGFLQMFGAAFSLGLLVFGGVTPLALSSVLITGIFTTVSILLFRVWKRGELAPGRRERIDRDQTRAETASTMFQIYRRERLTAGNKMKRIPHIASLAGLCLITTLCVSCSNNSSSSSYLNERVEDLKKQTAPSDASITETSGIASKGQSVTAAWEFDTSQTRKDYLEWVTHRLQPGYALESSGESRLVFGNHLRGDYESVKIEAAPTNERLHVKVTYVIFPD